MRSKIIAIEGIDQAGKRTQADLLAAQVRRMRKPVSVWSFPNYETPIGKQLNTYLKGRTLMDLRAVHLLYAANKWEVAGKISAKMDRGEIVIVNRYTPSNLAYGVAHGLPLHWLSALEEGLPKPNVVVVIDVSPQTSLVRKHEGRDIHEGDLVYLEKVRRAYRLLAKKYRWNIVDGREEPEEVRRLIWEKVYGTFR